MGALVGSLGERVGMEGIVVHAASRLRVTTDTVTRNVVFTGIFLLRGIMPATGKARMRRVKRSCKNGGSCKTVEGCMNLKVAESITI